MALKVVMATAMDASSSQAMHVGPGINADIRGETIVAGTGKIPKIVHQGWLKKKGKYILSKDLRLYQYSGNPSHFSYCIL